MVGRPINVDRQNAIALGFTTYTGTVHKKCGTTERYTVGGGCVHCARIIATEQREARVYLKKMQEQNSEVELDTSGDDGLDAPESDAERRARFEEKLDDMM